MALTLDGTSGMTAPQGAVYNGIATANVQTTSSGTAFDFTSIPLWVKRITVIFNNVSLSGTADILVQLGSGSVTSSGYVSTGVRPVGSATTQSSNSTAGFLLYSTSASSAISGLMTICLISGTTWISSHSVKTGTNTSSNGGGDVTLSGSLDRVRVTSTSTDTFDSGSINIMYE